MAKNLSVGLDMVEVSRFKELFKNKKEAFIFKVFSSEEIKYCKTFKDPSSHFAGMFAAKEAVSKALGVEKYPFAEIEIRHKKDGKPVAYKNGKKLSVSISITHTKDTASAIAIK